MNLRMLDLATRLLQSASGLAALLACSLVAYRVWSAPPPPRPPPAVYAPVTVATKVGDVRETESPANGFIIVVETQPEGTEVWVDGVLNGETPSSANFECKEGQLYKLQLRHSGYTSIEHDVHCKKDVMLVLNARLAPLRKR